MARPNSLRLAAKIAALAAVIWSVAAEAETRAQLVRCTDTNFESGFYGQEYGPTYHGSTNVCGGDPLDLGGIGIHVNFVRVITSGANPFNLYAVYWLPIGGDPGADMVYVGSFLTDGNGDARTVLRDAATPRYLLSDAPVDFLALVGANEGAGQFLVYSRGPYGSGDSDGDGRPDTLNTSDGTANGTFNNPVLWGGSTGFDGVQFISGFGF